MGYQQAGRDYWKDSYFIHHSFQSVADKLERIRADAERWEEEAI